MGLGKFGWSVAMTLAQSGCEVLAVDKNREIVEAIADEVTCAVHADMTNPKAVHSLGLESIDVAVIALAEDMETSIMGTILVKRSECSVRTGKGSKCTACDDTEKDREPTKSYSRNRIPASGWQEIWYREDSKTCFHFPMRSVWSS